ncbi:MAG: GNAT family N-acetyltransferase [Anaerolineae bacterium]|jgi:ribosomal protein S18 acetylase RimI-like enzyme
MTPTVRPARSEEARTLAAILIFSFPELSLRILGREPAHTLDFWTQTLEDTWGSGQWYVVESTGDALAGMGWMSSGPSANPLHSPEACRQYFGPWRGRWVSWALGLVDSPEMEAGQVYLDWIAVALSWRRQGLGRQLVLGLVEIAEGKGMSQVELEVEERKPHAKELYLQCGFREGKTRWNPLLTLIYSFSPLTKMIRDL